MKVSERIAELREKGMMPPSVDLHLSEEEMEMDSKEFIAKEHYEFPISVEPVHDMNGVPIENYRLIRRTDTDLS